MLKALDELKVKRVAAEVDRAKADLRQYFVDLRGGEPPAYAKYPALDVDKDSAALREWLEAKRKLDDAGSAVPDDTEVEVDEPKLANTYKVWVDRSDAAPPCDLRRHAELH